jgi:hypothetical protein
MISRCGDKFEMVAKQVLVFDGDSFGEGDCKRELDQSHSPRLGSSARLPKFVGERGQEGQELPHSAHIERWVELCAAAKGRIASRRGGRDDVLNLSKIVDFKIREMYPTEGFQDKQRRLRQQGVPATEAKFRILMKELVWGRLLPQGVPCPCPSPDRA